jgi:hypothetical protein
MSNITTDPFMTGGGPAIKFVAPGEVHAITVRKVTEKVDTDFATNAIKTWPNGDPKHVFVFEGEDEQGEPISLWVRGNMVKAIREATKDAGLKTVVDTKVTVKFDALGNAEKGMSPAKLFKAKVEKVAAAATVDPFSDDEESF